MKPNASTTAGHAYTCVGATGLQLQREAQLHFPDLSPGTYFVVPMSTGCAFGRYHISTSASVPVAAWDEEGQRLTPEGERAVLQLYTQRDTFMDGCMDFDEFSVFADEILKEEVPPEVSPRCLRVCARALNAPPRPFLCCAARVPLPRAAMGQGAAGVRQRWRWPHTRWICAIHHSIDQ